MRKQVLALYGLIVATLIAIALVIWAPITKQWVKRVVAEQMTKYMESPVTFSDIQIGFLPPSVEFDNIEFKKENSPLEFVSANKIKLTLGLSPSLSGRLRIKNVDIVEPTLKFNFSNFKFEEDKKAKKKKFRLPTLKDILKVQIDQIQISKTALSFEFPGKYFLDVDSETAGYRRDKKSEYWTWNGSGVARKGKKRQQINKVDIAAKRTGQSIEIEHFEINGVDNKVELHGQAYPEANLVAAVSGETDDLMQVLNDMDVFTGKLLVSGNYRIETRMIGPWDDLNQDGKVSLEKVKVEGRTLDHFQANFLMRKNMLKSVEGNLEINQSKLSFALSSIEQNKKAKFTVHSDQLEYGDVQRSIDPTLEPILHALLSADVQGDIQIQPFLMTGTYEVLGPVMTFDFPDMLPPYLPVQLKQIDISGNLHWTTTEGCTLEGPLKLAGVPSGQYKFLFPKPAIVDGTWEFNVAQFGNLFDKSYPVVGKGRITGGLKAEHTDLKALFSFDIRDLQYNRREKSSLTGDLILTDKGTDLSKIQILSQSKRGVANFNAHFAHLDKGESTVEGQVSDFDLGWISDLTSRRWPFVAGIQGRGSAKISLHGDNLMLAGPITFDSDNFDWKGERLEKVTAKLNMTESGLNIQDVQLKAEDFKVSGHGKINATSYDDLTLQMTKAPVALLGLPSWLSHYISRADGTLTMNGEMTNPSISANGKMYQINPDTTALMDAGTFSAKGMSTNLNWSLDAFDKKFVSAGVLQFGNHVAMTASGTMNKFTVLPQTKSSISGKWNFAGNLDEIKTWNGNINVDGLEIRNSKLVYKAKSPFDLTIQNGIFNLTSFNLGDRDTNVVIHGHTDVDENLFFSMKGRMPISLFTLLPLKLNRAEGAADVDLAWTGKLRNPVLNGKIHAVNAYIQDQLFPHALEDLEIVADIEQNRVKAHSFKGRMADGVIEGQGDLFLPTATEDMKIFLSGTVDQAWLRFPEWLPVLISGNFVLDGNLSKPLLKGDFTILEGMYRDEWDWKKQILTIGKSARTSRIYRKEDEGLQYDLAFRSDNGKFLLRNNIAKASLKGDIRVIGTNASLGLLGQIEILDGEVVFLDRKFKLSPGTVNFTNPNDINMAFDINATTRIDNTYTDIYLEIRTEQNQIHAYLTSNPVKDETAIISLLTFGVELNDLSVTTAAAQQGASLSLLPSVLSGPVQSRVETGLRKIKLIDTFQFVPYFSETTKTTSMKLVVAKQLFSRVRLSYATDMFGANTDNTFAVEHLINNNVKLQGSLKNVSDTTNINNTQQDLGLDLEFRFDF